MVDQVRICSGRLLGEASCVAASQNVPRAIARYFFVTAWLIVLMPFLFWWNTWFGRQLPDKQISEYLQDEKHPATSSMPSSSS